MAVNTVGNVLQPVGGPAGPPLALFGRASILGDATGGSSIIRFTLPAGFLWMPRFAICDVVSAQVGICRILNADETLPAGTTGFSETFTGQAALGVATNVVRFPPLLLQNVRRAADIELLTANVDTETNIMYLRCLRWDPSAAPAAWQAFWTTPP